MHLLYSKNVEASQMDSWFPRAKAFLHFLQNGQVLDVAHGKIMATIFYEVSTRTRFSFETAMLRLGGQVISNPMMFETSSHKKGETLYDTAQMVSRFADIIIMRHPDAGSVEEFSKGSLVPVLNAGDGANDHPTQGLLDLFTIWNEKGSLNDLTIAMIGDLKHSRVVHSQCELLKHFKNLRFILVSPTTLALPENFMKSLLEAGHSVVETENLEDAFSADVWMHTRIQKERFASEEEYLKYKGVYIVNSEVLKNTSENLMLLHPLPRVDEISVDVDLDPRARYFDQVQNGVALRMALLEDFL